MVAARTVLAVLLAGCVLCQVLVIPWLAAGAVSRFPEAAHLERPVTVLAWCTVAAVEAALVLVWPLLGLFRPGTVFRRRFLVYADALAGVLLAAAALCWAILDLLSRAQMCPPSVALGLLAGMAASGAAAVVVVVLRRRLKRAARYVPPEQPLAAAC